MIKRDRSPDESREQNFIRLFRNSKRSGNFRKIAASIPDFRRDSVDFSLAGSMLRVEPFVKSR